MKNYKHKIVNTSDLIPYVNNSRTHSLDQVRQVASSIKEFGFTNPILIDEDNGIIAGHGRLLAAEHLKIEKVPCIVLDDLTDAQKKAYVIADNQLALNAEWDLDKLKLEIEHLQDLDLDFDVDLLGLDDDLLNTLNDNIDDVSVNNDFSKNFNIVCETLEEWKKISVMFEKSQIKFKDFEKWLG